MAWRDIADLILPKAQAIAPIYVGSIDLNEYCTPDHAGKVYTQQGYGYAWENTPQEIGKALNVKTLMVIPWGTTGVKQIITSTDNMYMRYAQSNTSQGSWISFL